jgi:hypothetical protein
MEAIAVPIQRMIDATNSADTEAFLASFTADAYLSDWGRGFTGRDEIAKWNQTDNIGRQAHFEALASREVDGTQVVTLRVTGNGYNGTGDMEFTIEGDLISRMIIA